MKVLKRVLFIFLGVVLAYNNSGAQVAVTPKISDPTNWSYEVKKVSGNEYELIFHLSLNEGWHIWAIKPGGDGTLIPPTFDFNKNEKVNLVGEVMEKGKSETVDMEGIDGKVTYLTGKIDYVQKIKADVGTKIAGSHEYQVCNNDMCLPPKKKTFTFEINN
ncbi:MAG TPA: protein-disulfide reductase DsbD domain-containing protein [Flavipsychrobacter sp.]|nr:protein-disulfide reductase DsbD domain-containing protein [Flavipsychrobacter sp.]